MSVTDEVRHLLDERGAKWNTNDTHRVFVTLWNDASGHDWTFIEYRDGSFSKLMAYYLAPEQVVAATLGRGTCENEAPEPYYFVCSKCGIGLNFNVRFCPFCGVEVADERILQVG